MFEYVSLWWKVRKLKKAIWNQVKIEMQDDRKYIARRVSCWLKNGNQIWL